MAEERAHLLMREVNHRAKNLLTIVQAIAHQSAKDIDPQTFAENLTLRLMSLAASQDLIVSGNWVHVPIGDLVKSQLRRLEFRQTGSSFAAILLFSSPRPRRA